MPSVERSIPTAKRENGRGAVMAEAGVCLVIGVPQEMEAAEEALTAGTSSASCAADGSEPRQSVIKASAKIACTERRGRIRMCAPVSQGETNTQTDIFLLAISAELSRDMRNFT